MHRLFTRLYLQFFSSLLVILMVAILCVYLLAQQRLDTYGQNRIIPMAELAADAWDGLAPDEQAAWLALVSGLSGTQWERVDAASSPTRGFVIEDMHLSNHSINALIQLSPEASVSVVINDWHAWEQGYAWLFLDAISREAPEQREARFITLSAASPWDIERVRIQSETLPPLAAQQLRNGQSVRVNLTAPGLEALYVPAGTDRAIRFGPIRSFTLLSTLQWLTVVCVSLIMLSLSFMLWIRPVQRRFLTLFHSVDQISTKRESINLPTADTDELGQLARHIERMATHLIQQIETNNQLNQAVSHDLKTPLARIRFSLELLGIDRDNPYLQTIENDIELLIQLTDELLLFHQLKGSESDAPLCNVQELLAQHLSAMPDSVTLTSELPSSSVQLRIHPTHWLRLVNNLLDNAEQYGNGRIHVSMVNTDGDWTLTVEDNGPGLTAAEFETLKQPFQRLQSHRNLNKNNHGLGLALVDATAHHYGGTFTCGQSILGGAAMSIRLPGVLGTAATKP